MIRRLPITLKIIYIASFVALGVLVALTFVPPAVSGKEYTEVQKAQLLRTETEWILQFNIVNHEATDMTYDIRVTTAGETLTESVLIPLSGMFTYIYHAYPDKVPDGKILIAVRKQGESRPLEEATYYLKQEGTKY